MYANAESRFHVIIQDLAEALSKVTNARWDKVKVLYSYCPQVSDDGHFIIHAYSLDSLIALGKYYLKSNYQHTDKILPYLLNLLTGLTTAKWFHENIITEVPFAEKFSFCLNTLLTEISVSVSKDIFICQNNEIENIIFSIINDLNTGFSSEEKKIHFYSIKFPVFLGLAQSMVRYSSDSSFFCYLFSKTNPSIGIFHHIKANYDCPHINLFSANCEEANKTVPKSCNHVFKRSYCSYPSSSPISLIETLQSVMSEKNLMLLAINSSDFNQTDSISQFYFKNLAGIFRYGLMLLYRDLILQTSNLTSVFVQYQTDFLDRVYSSIKDYDSLKQFDSNSKENEEQAYQKIKINAVTKVICVQSLANSVNDYSEAENLCLRIAPLLMKKQDEKVLILNAPYIIASMDVLGTLAESFIGLSDIVMKPLLDFLSVPSPIISNLYKMSLLTNKSHLDNNDEARSKNRLFEYCVFKKVQNSAIENTCKTLKSASSINSDFIHVFLTKFSSLLYMEKNNPNYLVVVENVIVTLGHISYSMPSLSLTILQCFQQRLCRHSIISDIAIINQVGNMMILNRKMEVFLGALKTFSNILLEVNNDNYSEFNNISSNLYHVLNNVSDRLLEQPKIIAVFVRLLEIFVQTALDQLRNLKKTTNDRYQNAKFNRSQLLCIISLLGDKLENINQFKKQQERLFQDFWLYFIVSKGTLYFESIYSKHTERFAPKLPTLTSDALTDHDIREFSYTSSLNNIKILPQQLNELKSYIINFCLYTPEIIIIVNKLTTPQIIYLNSVCTLETIRIENSEKPSIEPLFTYLTNLKLQKDKYGMWQCICKVAEVIFKKFLVVVLNKERNCLRNSILAVHAKFLLVHFNNVHPQIRHIADKFLSELIDSFPHLLWNRQILWNIVDILTVLYYSETVDSSDQITSIQVPNTDYSIFLMETNKLRSEILNDFLARSRDIISEARKWQLPIVNAHLQEYILQDERSVTKDVFYKFRYFAWTALCSNENCHAVSNIITSLTVKSRYVGEISGLIKASGVSGVDFGKNLVKELWEACNNADPEEYKVWLQRVTAFVVSEHFVKNHIDLEIKHALTRSPISLFTEDIMLAAVECWNWISAYDPHFETELLVAIFEAWHYSMYFRMGAFSSQTSSNEMHVKFSSFVDAEPHNIWSDFIAKQISSAIYGYQDKVEIIVSFLNNILPMSIGGSECIMGRSVESVITRFSLLTSALCLVQAGVIEYIDVVIVRQRIYCSCLDYFCSLQNFPRKNGSKIKQTVKVLVKFWHILYSDKKHILKYKDNEPNPNENENESLSHNSVKSFDYNTLAYSFSHDFVRKRRLALCMLAEEIEFLSVWAKPSYRVDVDKNISVEEDKIRQWQSNLFSTIKYINEFVKSAWKISPVLAVYMPYRVRRGKMIFEHVSNVILLNPSVVSHIPHAMQLLATVENVHNDCEELLYLLTWANAGHLEAISLLSRDFPPNPYVLQYAVRSLLGCHIDTLSLYIPQLVQSLRYDSLGYIKNLLLKLVDKSQLFCHQLIWNMKSNMYLDVNMSHKSSLHETLDNLMNSVITNFSEPQRKFYEREFNFVDQITEVSSKIPRNLRGEEKQIACQKALRCINIVPGCYLPCDPDGVICYLDYKSGKPLQSKSRTPYLAKFLVYKTNVSEVDMDVSNFELTGYLSSSFPCNQNPDNSVWVRTIFKAGDDVRQDILALQTIRLLKILCNDVGLDVFLFPYNVVAIAPHMGVIQCIPNAYSRDELGKQTNVGLYDYFITKFGNEKSARFHEAQRSFIKSVAAYSIINFLLQTKDRHNGNIMLDDEGHIMHIDFGFMFESSPGGNLGFEPDMKLTEEMVMIMGGKMESEPFRWFTELCVKTYLIARKHQEQFITIVNLMLDSGLPCFRGQTIKLLKERFAPHATEREAAIYIITVIRNSFLNFRTVTYDMLQYLQNSIQY